MKEMDAFVKKWIPAYSYGGIKRISNALGTIQGPIFEITLNYC